MLWVSYGRVSQEGIQGMVTNPSNRAEAVGKLLEAYGGKLISYHMLMNGNIDFFIVSDIPDDKIADVAIVNAMLVRGSGAIETISTVPALRAEDAITQMQKAQQMASAMAYQAPTK
ncbi:MAG: GYD domain-containing protein [Deltaproteobacteria bacterium]|nr:GYD domain-containing protein [Deltaproteobacteria bacterium]